MKKIAHACVWLLDNAMAVILFILTFLVFINAMLRYLLNSGIDISEEMARLLFVWVTFLAAIIGCVEDIHVRSTALLNKLPLRLRTGVRVVGDVLMLGCSLLLAFSSARLAILNLNNHFPVSGISTGWVFVAGSFGGFGMAVAIVVNLIRHLRNAAPAMEETR